MDLMQAVRGHRLTFLIAVAVILVLRAGAPLLVIGSIWLVVQGVRVLRRRTLTHA